MSIIKQVNELRTIYYKMRVEQGWPQRVWEKYGMEDTQLNRLRLAQLDVKGCDINPSAIQRRITKMKEQLP